MPSDPKKTYYLDSCVLIDLIETPADQEPAKTISAIIADAEKGRFRLITSWISVTEVLWAKQKKDAKKLSAKTEEQIAKLWNPGSSPIHLIDVHELISREAVRLLRDNLYRGLSKTKGNDGIHLITAKREGADEFFTTEAAMKKWEQLMGYKICPPHYKPSRKSKDEEGGLFEHVGEQIQKTTRTGKEVGGAKAGNTQVGDARGLEAGGKARPPEAKAKGLGEEGARPQG